MIDNGKLTTNTLMCELAGEYDVDTLRELAEVKFAAAAGEICNATAFARAAKPVFSASPDLHP